MLIETRITVDGTDITHFIAEGGVKWSRNDIDGNNAGRSLLSGDAIRDRLATKIRLDITCRKLTYQELQTLVSLLYPEFVSVYYADPLFGIRTAVMYCNKNEAEIFRRKPNGTEQWTPGSFALVEK